MNEKIDRIFLAQDALMLLRNRHKTPFSTKFYHLLIDDINTDVRGGYFSFSEIGTSEEELKQIRSSCYKIVVDHCLKSLRAGSELYVILINRLVETAREGKISLTDLGTNEEEFIEFQTKGCKVKAQAHILFLRHCLGDPVYSVACIREAASEGNFSLADIGTSEKELSSYVRKNT